MKRAALLTVLGLLAACSDSGDASTTSSPEATTASTTVADEPTTTVEATTTTTIPAPPARPQTIDELLELGRPIVLAHTAGEDQYPGSTLFGFAESVADGADMLDMNVLLTADGVLIVQHDLTVDRTTSGTGALADLTYDEVAALDNAYWFTADCGVCTDQPDDAYIYRGIRTGEQPAPEGYTADDFAIPTFRELVTRFPDLPLNIEIKGEGEPALAAAQVLADELVELGRADASVVTSFDDATVAAFHELLPDVELSPSLGPTSDWVLNGVALPDGMRILQIPPSYGDLVVITPELIAKATEAGYVIWVWPNNRDLENYDSYLAFLESGIAGLNINFPEQAVKALQDFIAK
ncbi:MAG: glycerophosphodiester phosphodiesterase [Actinomycetia bacterium]|nr:glycerophosphodiester phosphodiesterase [Actinomycetes bacterium]